MEEYEKNLIKNNMTALAHDANSYIEMGFPHDKLKFEILNKLSNCEATWNHQVMAQASSTYSKILKESLSNYELEQFFIFSLIAFEKLWGGIEEYQQLWNIPKLASLHDELIYFDFLGINLRYLFVSVFLLSLIILFKK